MSLKRYLILAASIFSLLLSACKSPVDEKQLEAVSKEFRTTLSDLKTKIEELTPSSSDVKTLTNEEMAKLFNFEYKVIELALASSAQEIESELQALGNDRWECFQALANAENFRLLCKRRPKTYLRYIPRVF